MGEDKGEGDFHASVVLHGLCKFPMKSGFFFIPFSKGGREDFLQAFFTKSGAGYIFIL